jgi:hypothetical protein
LIAATLLRRRRKKALIILFKTLITDAAAVSKPLFTCVGVNIHLIPANTL